TTVAVQPSGKVLLSGTRYVTNRFQLPASHEFLVVRLSPDGSLDPTFDADGRVSVAVDPAASSLAGARAALVRQSDGRIIVAGTTGAPAGADPFNQITVVRLTASGDLDSTFGSGGKVTFGVGANRDTQARAVALQADGKIVVGGLTARDLIDGAN